jgi:hypothetical protein
MGYIKKAGDPDKWIPKEELKEGMWYEGKCRNSDTARWKEGKFHYQRYKCGSWFWDELECPENDRGYDVFFPFGETNAPDYRY